MANMDITILEQRLKNIEGELESARERIRACETKQRQAIRRSILTLGGAAALLMLGSAVPVSRAERKPYNNTTHYETTLKAPLRVVDSHDNMLMEVAGTPTGGVLRMFNSPGGVKIVALGAEPVTGMGGLTLSSGGPETGNYVVAGFSPDARPQLYVEGPKTLAGLGLDTQEHGELEIQEGGAVIARLDAGPESGGGFLTLYSAKGQPMVEAGSNKNAIGSVRAYGPTGKCNAASGLAGIAPCYIAGR